MSCLRKLNFIMINNTWALGVSCGIIFMVAFVAANFFAIKQANIALPVVFLGLLFLGITSLKDAMTKVNELKSIDNISKSEYRRLLARSNIWVKKIIAWRRFIYLELTIMVVSVYFSISSEHISFLKLTMCFVSGFLFGVTLTIISIGHEIQNQVSDFIGFVKARRRTFENESKYLKEISGTE